MTTIRKMQKTFDGTDTTLAWQHVLDYSHHSPEPTDYYYNCFYVCPEDKAVEIEIVQLQARFGYSSTYAQPNAWICLFPAATSSDAWMHGTYDRRHYDRASVVRYLTSDYADSQSNFVTWPTIDPEFRITTATTKIKMQPGDRLVAYVYSPEIEWGSVAYSTYFEPLDRHFTFNAIVYEETVVGSVYQPVFGIPISGYINDTVNPVIYIQGNLASTFTVGKSVKVHSLATPVPPPTRSVYSNAVYMSAQNLTRVELAGGLFSTPQVALQDNTLYNVTAAGQSGSYSTYTVNTSNTEKLRRGSKIKIFCSSPSSSYYTTIKEITSGATTIITTYDPFVLAYYPMADCSIEIV